jgi:hypothetical protein
MPYQPGVVEAIRDWGLTVHLVPGWQTRGDDFFHPDGHVFHHDVIGDQAGTHDHVPTIIIAGRPDLAGPLANFWLERDGDVHVVAVGEANHAGEGGWRGLSGNATVWGTEMNNLGTPADPWPDVQIEAAQRLAAATADFSGFPIANVCGHKEWAPTRKIDPHTINMSVFRAEALAQVKGGFTIVDEATKTYFDTKFALRKQADLRILRNLKKVLVKLGALKLDVEEIDRDIAELDADIPEG